MYSVTAHIVSLFGIAGRLTGGASPAFPANKGASSIDVVLPGLCLMDGSLFLKGAGVMGKVPHPSAFWG